MKTQSDPIQNAQVAESIEQWLNRLNIHELKKISNDELIQTWRNWLLNDSYNYIEGLDQFQYATFAAGTSVCFGEFIHRFPTRRVRVSRDDFALTRVICKNFNRELLYLEDAPLADNDMLIISLPFSGNGSVYPDFEKILDSADTLNVPVFVDGAYYGISHDIKYPLHHNCITDFVVSLSKNLSPRSMRLGIRFTKEMIDDGVSQSIVGADIFDRLGSWISIKLMNQYAQKWIIDQYMDRYNDTCDTLDLIKTNTITLALSNHERFKEYHRGEYNRVCITDEITKNS